MSVIQRAIYWIRRLRNLSQVLGVCTVRAHRGMQARGPSSQFGYAAPFEPLGNGPGCQGRLAGIAHLTSASMAAVLKRSGASNS